MRKNHRIILIFLFFIPLIFSIIMFGVSETPVESPTKNEFTFMTYNIHFGQGGDDLLNFERLAQNILVAEPDIIGLQEVENGRMTTQGVDMTFWLAKRLNMYYYYYPAESEHSFGCALLSKYPITSQRGEQIPSISMRRVYIHCVVRINSSLELDVFVTHLGTSGENRTRQVNFLVEKIEPVFTSSTKPKILMGDFNLRENWTHPEESTIYPIHSYFNNTGIAVPVDQRARIDHIYASGYQEIVDYYVLRDMLPEVDTPAEFGSDHVPTVATLTFPIT